MRTERRKLAVIAGVVSVLLAGVVVNASAHGGDTGKVHGCVANGSNLLRVVGASEDCKSNETAIDWNIEGVPGPPGPQGEQGPAGPEGPPGPAGGLSGVEVVATHVYSSPVSKFNDEPHAVAEVVFCPADQYAISGGYSYFGPGWDDLGREDARFVVRRNGPHGDAEGRPIGWSVHIVGYPAFNVIIEAVCAAA